jgi:hypothetical protein
VVACSAAPSPHVASLDQDLLRCTAPFSVVVAEDALVADDDFLRCASIAGPPAPPPYAPSAIPSCAATSIIAPVPALSGLGCTYGRSLTGAPHTNAYFLCPIGAVLPPSDPNMAGYGATWAVSVGNGCFGDSTDASYAYVWYAWHEAQCSPEPFGGCGAECSQP